MRRRLEGSVVVLVGATSGAGRAAALAFAGHHARLVLAARDEAALQDVAAACRTRGAEVIAVPADITDAEAVERLGARALERFGRIDTWVNAAGVLVAGPIESTPIAELDRLIDTNVRGTLLASRVAMREFNRQGSGVLINVSSVLGVVPNPVVPAYTMSKAAVRGLTLCLRTVDTPRAVRCCVVLPGPLDTPMFEHAANHTGRELRSVPPACAPERAAAAIVACARRPRRQAPVGLTARVVLLGARVVPRVTERAVAAYSGRLLLRPVAKEDTPGLVFAPAGERRIDGGWRRGGPVRRRAGAALGRALAARS